MASTKIEVTFSSRRSRRTSFDDVAHDLAKREGTKKHNIGIWKRRLDKSGTDSFPVRYIEAWARNTKFDSVVWTALESNYNSKVKGDRYSPFAPGKAKDYLKALPYDVQRKAVEYICRAPSIIETELRCWLEEDNWYSLLLKT